MHASCTRISMRIQNPLSLPGLSHHALSISASPTFPKSTVRLPEAMGLARITIFFSVISSLFLLFQARHAFDNFSSAAVTLQDPPEEDTDRKAVAVPLEKPSSSDESIPTVEGFHHVVDLHLRRPIHLQFLPRETRHGSSRIGFPRRLRGEMRWIPTRRTLEADDVFEKLAEATAQDLTEVDAEEMKEWIPVEWKAKEEEEEESKRKKKKRNHKKKKEDSDSDSDSDDEEEDSDSDSDDEEEERKEIKKKKKKRTKLEEGEREEGGLMQRFWAFLNRF